MHRYGRRRGALLLHHADLGARGAQDHDARRTRHGAEPRTDAARLHRGAGCAMRLLHPRDDAARAGAARAPSGRFGSGDPRGLAAEPLPLRHAHAHRARRGPGERGDERRRQAVKISRRAFIATSGALVVSFSLPARLYAQGLPGALQKTPLLDAWIRIAAGGRITIFTGKAELGQGIKTALLQIAAEQLAVQPGRIELVTADTARTPNEGYT